MSVRCGRCGAMKLKGKPCAVCAMYKKVGRKCAECGKPFTGPSFKRFCSKQCGQNVHERGVYRSNPARRRHSLESGRKLYEQRKNTLGVCNRCGRPWLESKICPTCIHESHRHR